MAEGGSDSQGPKKSGGGKSTGTKRASAAPKAPQATDQHTNQIGALPPMPLTQAGARAMGTLVAKAAAPFGSIANPVVVDPEGSVEKRERREVRQPRGLPNWKRASFLPASRGAPRQARP